MVIIAARESLNTLLETFRAATNACMGVPTHFDLVINGNPDLAESFGRSIADLQLDAGHQVRVWQIRIGDKALAWNQYLHRIWPTLSPRPEVLFSIDGYAQVRSDACILLADALDRCDEDAMGAAAAPR